MKSKLLSVFKGLMATLMIMLASDAWAQQTEVKGLVQDEAGEPIIGATVREKGNEKFGTSTDIDGNFVLKVTKPNATLTVTYVGMEPETVSLGGRTDITITMRESSQNLNEVVVVGYGTSKKVDLTGSVASLTQEQMKQGISTNADQMLQGKIAGVQVTSNSGAPGAATSIRIRGASSINGSNEPLYIIDGLQVSGDAGEIGGFNWTGDGSSGQTNTANPLASIAPSDILSIDVLKDASATAIYGAAGANGVVIVTTKKGQAGRVNVNLDAYLAWQQVAKKLDMLDLPGYAQYQLDLYNEGANNQLNDSYRDVNLLGKGTDWQDEIFRTALMQNYQLSVTGGNDKVNYAVSGGWMDQDGIIIGSDFNRFNSRVSVDTHFTKWLKLGGKLAYTRTNETITLNDGSGGIIMQAMTMQPDVPVYDFAGNYASPTSVNGSSSWNPVALALQRNNSLRRQTVMGNFYGDLDFAKYFTFHAEYGFNAGYNLNKSYLPRIYEGVKTPIEINQIYQRADENFYWLQKDYLTYHQEFADKHDLQVMAGFEASESSWEGWWLTKKNLTTDNIHVMGADGELTANDGWKDRATTVSWFGRVNYNFDNRYLLTFTMRADGSSKFAKENKWGYFPSAAFAWRASEEKFLRDVSWLSNLKLRLGYGQVGNSNIGTYKYGSLMHNFNTPMGSAFVVDNLPNDKLKWEASEQFNAGIDFSVLNGRIDLTVDGYYKQTKDLLLQVVVPDYTGISSEYGYIQAPFSNIGKVRNVGVEVALNTRNIENRNFTWTSNLTLTHNKNKVLKLNNADQVIYGDIEWYLKNATMIAEGLPMGVFYGYKSLGVFKDMDDILNSPVQVPDENNPNVNKVNKNTGLYPGDIKFADINNDGVIDEKDKCVIGDPNPDLTFGFTNVFHIYDFDVTLGLTGAIGGDILNFTRYKTESLTSLWDNQAAAITDRAQYGFIDGDNTNFAPENVYITNPDTDIPRYNNLNINQNDRLSTRFIEDGSYLRIQNLAIGYNFPQKWIKKLGMTQARIYFNVQNLYTFTKYKGFDPEIGAYNQSVLMQNVDMGRYPTPRTYTVGVNLQF